MEAKGIENLTQVKVSLPKHGNGTFIATYLGEDNEVGYRELSGDLGEPFDPSYLEGASQELRDYLFPGEIGYCKKLNTLTKYIRKSGIIGKWDDKNGQFVVTRKIERNMRTRTGRISKRMEVCFNQDAYMWVDDDTHEYVVDIAVGFDDSKEFYRGTHVRDAVATAVDWQHFDID